MEECTFIKNFHIFLGDMYRPEDYPELNGKEPDWVASEREMFKEHRDKDGDGRLNEVKRNH